MLDVSCGKVDEGSEGWESVGRPSVVFIEFVDGGVFFEAKRSLNRSEFDSGEGIGPSCG